ncbi:MAG: type IV pilus biogenesis/stability protein PilW [Burkholderiaceae bacterium]|nr:type IV pilus biogenesis/stability protein PilW [Burkholderiaceae bacterium]
MSRLGRTLFSFPLIAALLIAGCASSGHSGNELPTSSDQTSAQKRAAINTELAVGYYQRGEKEVALDKVKLALAADSEFADAYSVRGLIYMDMGENRLAEENFQRAIRLAPDNADFSNNYGWFLCQNGRAKESISYFEAALKSRKYESPGKAMDNAGICSLKMNDAAAAERYFLRAFQFDPGNPQININLAKLYYGKRDYERANFYVGRVIQAGSSDASVLWLGIKVAHKVGDRLAEAKLGTQLHTSQPNSIEYATYQRGAFDE